MPWKNNRRIIGLFANRNSQSVWVYFRFGTTNEGWDRLRPGSSDGVTNLTILSMHAKADKRPVNYLEDPANRVSAMYVW